MRGVIFMYDYAAQRLRREAVTKRVAELCAPLFDGELRFTAMQYNQGSYQDDKSDLPLREKMSFGVTFLAAGLADIGNRLISLCLERGAVSGHFFMHKAICALCRFSDRLTPENRAGLLAAVGLDLDHAFGPETSFSGINDNFQFMHMLATLVGGRLTGREDAVRRGRELKEELFSMLSRRGFVSEYTSPNYTSIALQALSDIDAFAPEENLRPAIRRILADAAAHYHAPTARMAGPHSRVYTADTVAHVSAMDFVYHFLFGGGDLYQRLLCSQTAQPDLITHHGVHFTMAECGWYSTSEYFCEDEFEALALEKKFPFEIEAQTECRARHSAYADGGFVYPGGVADLYSYMTPSWALGAASRDFSGGDQTDAFSFLYRKPSGAGTLFMKYNIGGARPGEDAELPGGVSNRSYYLHDQGRKNVFARENTALVLCRPKQTACLECGYLSLDLPMSAHRGDIEAVFLGQRRVEFRDGLCASAPGCETVFVLDGEACFAVRPLGCREVRISRVNGYAVISLIDRDGEPRESDFGEICSLKSGFVFVCGSRAQAGEVWRAAEGALIRDEIVTLDRFPTERRTRVSVGGHSFETALDPETETLRFAMADGRNYGGKMLYIQDFMER